MKFTTPVSISKSEFDIAHQQAILLMGSCFAVSIGEKSRDNKFNVTVNPNGIIYNPISIVHVLKRLIENRAYTNDELFQTNENWISFNHHGSFSALDKSECLAKINSSNSKACNPSLTCLTGLTVKTTLMSFKASLILSKALKISLTVKSLLLNSLFGILWQFATIPTSGYS